ncbi:sensor histidine kinase [Kutzneria sp. NPDC052558]|uniref:sensor histidine kinase n=1 Tax=Kutzneria sp. NPDC052558 TaxID=3364121 RepID=UPI0037C54F73
MAMIDREQWLLEVAVRPVLTLGCILVTALEFPDHEVIARPFTTGLLVVVSILGLATIFPWRRLPQWTQLGLLGLYALTASLLLPLAQPTLAPMFAFLAASATGKLAGRKPAVAIAVLTSVSSALAVAAVNGIAPSPTQWPWWEGFVTGLPAYVSIARTDRLAALANAKRAASEAMRAAESEAREATLLERGRIARELHDVLGHSLTGIALQLDMADALNENDRRDEATQAIRHARKLAVDSIVDMRGAVEALREDTVPLSRILRGIADNAGASLTVQGEERAVPAEVAHAVHRTAQEALTNAAKHAPGATVTMELVYGQDSVALTVVNGQSNVPVPAGIGGGTGLGLAAMRDRAVALGGALDAGPADGGWTVRLTI